MNEPIQPVQRVIGFDGHPDSFTAAVLRGPTPAAAIVEKVFNKVPMSQLSSWAKKHTTEQDLFVMEASGNSFHAARSLAEIMRRAKVLESCQMGKLKEAHANNDKLSAVRIGCLISRPRSGVTGSTLIARRSSARPRCATGSSPT
jgi:hypothetical protein